MRVVDSAATATPARQASVAPSGNRIDAGRVYRSRHVRWVARRPPEAIPAPAPRAHPRTRVIPRYTYLPLWGLRDTPHSDAVADDRRIEVADVRAALRLVGGTLAISAIVHLIRYIVLVVNRTSPIPGWLDTATAWLVVFVGLFALATFVFATVVAVRWVRALRVDAYRRHDRLDPRPLWQLILFAGVPIVNLVGLGVLLHEVAALRDDLDTVRTHRRLTKIWVGWAIVNAFAVVGIVTRLVALQSGSIQTAASALALVIVSAVVSSAFAYWLAARIDAVFTADQTPTVPARRWVAVA
ncbi:hypothetical protein GS4_23_01150 [Gordonia soli NBRC 108243]|uniref:DUF4328 domain-containing protein n=1 Tax=Gordonia soli NBRC 108243 TaxID=1223545 RepID=M0QL79_9ACTN|nr:hypothetical protein GS4_23_01150 [Gordonia soli NBRC 108243]